MKKIKFKVVGRTATLLTGKHEAKLKEHLSYSVPGARFSPMYRAGAWDGKISMLKRKQVSIGLLRALKEDLHKAGWKVKLDTWKNRPNVEETKKGIISKDSKYAYQNDCVSAMRKSIKWGGGLILSATGSGKTAMAAMLASWIKSPILFVVDQLNLLYQGKKEIEDWLSKHEKKSVKVGVVGNSEFKPQRVTCATIQTLFAHKDDRKFIAWFKTVEVVIIDEIHVQMSRRNFHVMDKIKPKAIFGLTATLQLRRKPIRLRAYSICGPVVYEFPIAKGVEAGVLTKSCTIQVRIYCDEILQGVQPYYHYDSKNRAATDYKWNVVRNDPVNKAIVAIVEEALKRDKYVIALVERRRHLSILKKMLKKFSPQI